MPVDYAHGFGNPAPALSRQPRPDYDYFNARLRANYNPDYDEPGDPVGHKGVDLAAPGGSSAEASADGVVRQVDLTNDSDAGCHVDILHREPTGGWYLTRYLHLQLGSIRVTPGQTVAKRDFLGRVGMTGNAHYNHIHFEIRYTPNLGANTWGIYGAYWGTPHDPLKFGILAAPAPTPRLVRVTVDRPMLRSGATGKAVKELQALLAVGGYGVPLDGVFDSATVSAVKAFQGSKGLTADGIVGTNTWTALLDY